MSKKEIEKAYDNAAKIVMESTPQEVMMALVHAADTVSKLCVVLETYIGSENVVKLVSEDCTDEFIDSLVGPIEGGDLPKEYKKSKKKGK